MGEPPCPSAVNISLARPNEDGPKVAEKRHSRGDAGYSDEVHDAYSAKTDCGALENVDVNEPAALDATAGKNIQSRVPQAVVGALAEDQHGE